MLKKKKKPLRGQAVHSNITNQIPANHQQDTYGNIGGGADFQFCFIVDSNVNGSDVMQDNAVHPELKF